VYGDWARYVQELEGLDEPSGRVVGNPETIRLLAKNPDYTH
jgi:hypothetical protein